MQNRFLSLFLVFGFSLLAFSSAFADSMPSSSTPAATSAAAAEPMQVSTDEMERRITAAKTALEEIMASQDKSIPEELLAKCKAIAIYPRVLKGAFIFGARYGRGVVLNKGADGKWGPIAFSTLAGGNAGFQIGGQLTDYVLVIMNDRGLQGLLSNNFTMGADASFAAGPVGRKSSIGTDLSLRSEILAYAHSKGLFAGISLDGAVLTQDNNSNSLYYGKNVTSHDILLDQSVEVQPSSEPLVDALNHYSAIWDSTKHENLTRIAPGQEPDYQGYVESVDYASGTAVLIDSRPMKDPAQGKVANLTVKFSPNDLASLKLEDEIQIYFDVNSSGNQKTAKKIIKLPSRHRA